MQEIQRTVIYRAGVREPVILDLNMGFDEFVKMWQRLRKRRFRSRIISIDIGTRKIAFDAAEIAAIERASKEALREIASLYNLTVLHDQ